MISLIPQDHVNNVWSEVGPIIQKAVDQSPGRFDVVDILTEAMLGNVQLWIGFNEDDRKIHSAGITRIYEVPLARVLSIQWLAGSDLQQWIDEAIQTTESFARDQGCTRIEIIGREAWGRIMKDYHKLHTTFEKEL